MLRTFQMPLVVMSLLTGYLANIQFETFIGPPATHQSNGASLVTDSGSL